MRQNVRALIINGLEVPAFDEGCVAKEATYGKFKRNAKNQTVGQVVGRPLWKIEGLQWSELTVDQWAAIKEALKPFFVNVTWVTDTNETVTIRMYPSDRTSTPVDYDPETNKYKRVKNCKFNLIDCGY